MALRERNRRAVLVLAAGFFATFARAQQIPRIEPASTQNADIRLEVFVNGRPTQLLVAATRLPDARIAVARSELAEAGIKAPGDGEGDEQIDLDRAGLRYRYDESRQSIYFDLPDEQRVAKVYDGRGERPAAPPSASAWGALINYSAFASASSKLGRFAPNLGGVNTSLDMRLFSPYGVVTQTGIVGNTLTYDLFRFGGESGLRLDTTYSFADDDNLVMYNAGDVISAGFQWTRPVRLGGLQAQRSFALRADLVTTPTPFVSGSAAVPSTVDVFVNGSKTYSQQVGEGPFSITNLPISTSDGRAEVVIRDASGRETRQELALFSGQTLIAPGQADFSLELGVARRYFNLRSFDYDRRPVGSGSVRYGVTDRITAKGHAEGGAALANLGAGVATSLGRFGNLEVALSGSRRIGPTLLNGWRNGVSVGGQAFASYSLATPFGVGFHLSAQRAFGNYEDLASTTAQFAWLGGAAGPSYLPGSFTGIDIYPPRMVLRLSASARLYGIGGTASVALGHVSRVRSLPAVTPKNSTVVSASYSRELPFEGSLFITAYADLNGSAAGLAYPYQRGPNMGLFAGISFPLGEERRVSFGAQSVPNPVTGRTSLGANAQMQKAMGGELGSYGWSVTATQGETPLRGGSASYRSPIGVARVSGLQQGKLVNGAAQLDGAIAVTSAGIVAGPPVTEAFAVVSAGAPDVTVLQDNRVVGRTNIFGQMLVPTLRPYGRNRIAIDPNSLPADAIPKSTEEVVAPKYRSGVGVDFGVETDVRSALLILSGPDGKYIETGRRGRVEGGDSFVVGYDGRAYVRRLSQSNTIIVDLGDRDCRAAFEYDQSTGPHHAVKATCE